MVERKTVLTAIMVSYAVTIVFCTSFDITFLKKCLLIFKN